MARLSKIERNLPVLKSEIARSGKIFSSQDFTTFFERFKEDGLISKNSNSYHFAELLVADKFLQVIPISGHQELIRYATGDVSQFDVALSIARPTAISHASALSIHGLGSQNSRIVYVTQEQSEKFNIPVLLKQYDLDAAFSKPQRPSKSIFKWSRYEIHLLKGKYSHGLGIQHIQYQDSWIYVTDIEKTLLDITVRPLYAGGPVKIFEAYKNSRGKVSIEKLCEYLQKMNFIYPYHQLIGYYLQHTGYPDNDIELFRKIPRQVKFYLDYNIKDKNYDPVWQVYTPRLV